MATITVYFNWASVEADPRAYKPGKPVLEPQGLKVAVEVPLDHEHIWNVNTFIQAQLDVNAKNLPDPILTMKGYAYCIHALEDSLRDESPDIDDDIEFQPDSKLIHVEAWSDQDDEEFTPTGD